MLYRALTEVVIHGLPGAEIPPAGPADLEVPFKVERELYDTASQVTGVTDAQILVRAGMLLLSRRLPVAPARSRVGEPWGVTRRLVYRSWFFRWDLGVPEEKEAIIAACDACEDTWDQS